jgi:Threonyl-tRNA synthetase
METIKIYCKNTEKYYKIAPGTQLVDLLEQIGYKGRQIQDKQGITHNLPPIAAYVDNKLKELSFPLYIDHSIEFLDYSNDDGRRVYIRSLNFVLQKAVRDLFPDKELILDYNLPNGTYGELVAKPEEHCNEIEARIENVMDITPEQISSIKNRMHQIIESNIPIIKKKLCSNDAIAMFKSHKQFDKAFLCEFMGNFFVSVYFIENYGDTFYGPMLQSTGYINSFDLVKYNKGFCVQSPIEKNPFNLPKLNTKKNYLMYLKKTQTGVQYWVPMI